MKRKTKLVVALSMLSETKNHLEDYEEGFCFDLEKEISQPGS